MHVPDGFLDAPTSIGTGRGRRRRRRDRPARRPPRARRPDGAAGRPRRGVHLRRPDAQLPGRLRHQRPPARAARWRRSWSGPFTALLCMSYGLPRPVPALRRRRHHRARHQHRPDGRHHRRGRLDRLQGPPGGAAQAARPWSPRPPASPRWSRCRWPRSVFVGLYAIGGTADLSLGNLAAAMVGVHALIGTRRGGHHLPGGRQHPRRPPRPRVRRPAGARQARARRPHERSGRVSAPAPGRRAGILVVALLLAGVVSFYAASSPDGLTKVSLDKGFADTEEDHGAATARSPATAAASSTTSASPVASRVSSAS